MKKDNQSDIDIVIHSISFKILGITLGLLSGSILFLATNWLILKGPISEAHPVGEHLGLLSHFLIGYSVTFKGSIIGFLYGFTLGTLTGSLIAWFYSLFVRLRVKINS